MYRIRTNSLGFKDSLIREIDLDTGGYRILFMGDSFTEGIGFPFENTFVGRIAEAYKPYDIEVLNAAVGSYSPIIYWRKTRYLVEDLHLRFNELIVFLDISDAYDEAEYYTLNDREDVIDRERNPVNNSGYLPGLGDILRTHTIGIYFFARTLQKALGMEPDHRVNQRAALWTTDRNSFREFGERGLELMAVYMEKLFDLLQRNDITLTVAVYPWPDQIINNDLHSIQVEFWQAWCATHEVRFINYFPEFVLGGNADGVDILGTYFIPGDVHWNGVGHKLVADRFLAIRQPGTLKGNHPPGLPAGGRRQSGP
jgi:hypothetical protein